MLETQYMKLWEQDGILFCIYANNIDLDLEIAKHCVEQRLNYSKGRSYPVFVNMTGVRSVDKPAREYFATRGLVQLTAGALIVNSPLSKFLVNIFLKINKPKIPSRLFTNEKEASDWLKNYINYAHITERQTA